MYSAEIAGDEEDEKEAAKNATLTEEELSAKKAKEAKQFQWLLYITVAISIVVSVAAFMLLPYALASLLRKVGASEVGVTVAEAFVKLALFMGYMLLISRMKDIQRTFMYHGAEHKCINVWNMDFHLLWKMSWQAPDSTKDVGQVSFFW